MSAVCHAPRGSFKIKVINLVTKVSRFFFNIKLFIWVLFYFLLLLENRAVVNLLVDIAIE